MITNLSLLSRILHRLSQKKPNKIIGMTLVIYLLYVIIERKYIMVSPWKTIRRNSHAVNVITMVNSHDKNNNTNIVIEYWPWPKVTEGFTCIITHSYHNDPIWGRDSNYPHFTMENRELGLNREWKTFLMWTTIPELLTSKQYCILGSMVCRHCEVEYMFSHRNSIKVNNNYSMCNRKLNRISIGDLNGRSMIRNGSHPPLNMTIWNMRFENLSSFESDLEGKEGLASRNLSSIVFFLLILTGWYSGSFFSFWTQNVRLPVNLNKK